jgi:hypothetical protein
MSSLGPRSGQPGARIPRFPIPYAVLEEQPEVSVARVTLGLTVYLDQPLVWARAGAGQALHAFLGRVGATSVPWLSTSASDEWLTLDERRLAEAERRLCDWTLVRPRHHFAFRLVDDPGAPAMGFSYHEVDPTLEARAACLQLFLPPYSDPNELLQLALGLGQALPFASGVGGYLASWNELWPAAAFGEIWSWVRRYAGIDVQDPDAMGWEAAAALPGVNWLTLIGAELAARRGIDVAALGHALAPHDGALAALGHGTLIRAGRAPTLGDHNRLAWPDAYATVAAALRPHFVELPPAFPGAFADDPRDDRTRRWFRRLLEPEAW